MKVVLFKIFHEYYIFNEYANNYSNCNISLLKAFSILTNKVTFF